MITVFTNYSSEIWYLNFWDSIFGLAQPLNNALIKYMNEKNKLGDYSVVDSLNDRLF